MRATTALKKGLKIIKSVIYLNGQSKVNGAMEYPNALFLKVLTFDVNRSF
jgi:hypothetical protein